MKKLFLLLVMAAMLPSAFGQFRIIYVPGDGEHQFGISLSPTYSSQLFGVGATAGGADLETSGQLTNSIGVGAGLFYGYETRHNRTIEFGNYLSVYYTVNPFSGTVDVMRDGQRETHTVQYNAQRIVFHFNPFLSYMINEQLSVSAGLGASLGPQLLGRAKVDGSLVERPKNSDESVASLILSLFNIPFDVNAGVKYWFSDELFCGLRVQYCFYTLSMLSLFDEGSNLDLNKFPNGAVGLDLTGGTAVANYVLPKSTVQAVVSLGYVW